MNNVQGDILVQGWHYLASMYNKVLNYIEFGHKL